MSQRVANNKLVEVTYSITDESGEILENSDLPISYVHGHDSGLFPEVEKALRGCVVGDKVSVTLPPERGFGAHDPELTFTDDIDNVPPEYRYVGAQVEFENEEGETRLFHVSRIADGKLTVDGNHPFAGKTVTFHVTVAAIRDATAAEIGGQAMPPSAVRH